jgi:HK97 family phage major capsid protein
MLLFELRSQREHALAKADNILKVAENARRALTKDEQLDLDTSMAAVNALSPRIKALENQNTILKQFPRGIDAVISDGGRRFQKPHSVLLSDQYAEDFAEYVQSNGQKMGAALYEGGGGTTGGYVVPITVDGQIVPLAPQEMSVRKLATVIPTVMDIKIPTKTAFGTAALKAESGGSSISFNESEFTLGQFTLSAFMAGIQEVVSWELAQDWPLFQSTTVDDMLLAQGMLEENLYVNGTGTGQAQGLIGNVGAGTSQALSLNGVLDLIATLNAIYHPGASFLMQRATGVALRKLQVTANLFNPAWTRVGDQDFLYGYPVFYSQSMPENTGTNTPILFGDFKRGYIIGDRGGSGIYVKVLDQPRATEGLLVLLAYRRTDGRVRRSEAIQGYTL